jgi:hypothetical protein
MWWASGHWHLLESKAVILGVIARPGGPTRLLDLEARILLAFIEGFLRESEEHDKKLTEFYDAAKPKPPEPKDREARNQEIMKAQRLFM